MKNTKLPIAIAGILLGSICVTNAQATTASAAAEAVFELQNFQLSNSLGQQLVYNGGSGATGINFSSISTTESDSATVNGSGTTLSTANPTYAAAGEFELNNLTNNLAALGLGASYLNPITSSSATLVAPILPTTPGAGIGFNGVASNVAISASSEVGSPVSNTPITASTNTAAGTGATLYSASYASSVGNNTNNSTETSTLVAKYTISNTAGAIDFTGNVASYAAALLSSGAAISATAGYTLTFNLVDITPVINTTLLNQSISGNVSDSTPGTGSVKTYAGDLGSVGAGGVLNPTFAFNFLSGPLVASDTYQLTATLVTNANVATNVPEPEILALMGIGLLGMSAASSRKAAKSNNVIKA